MGTGIMGLHLFKQVVKATVPERFLPIRIRLRPAMSKAELACYERMLSQSNIVIEYGAGGSTAIALKSNIKQLVSVETDPRWINKLREFGPIRRAEASGRLMLLHADVGPVGSFGVPVDNSGAARYEVYSALPWRYCTA